MAALGKLKNFTGDVGENSAEWFKSFVTATSTYDVGAVLRMFPAYLEPNSPAQEWYDGLLDNEKVTWSAVDRNFRRRWVSVGAGGHAKTRKSEVDTIRNHRLTDDAIFALTSTSDMKKFIVDWADEHVRLGAATGLDDVTLILATAPYLPAFLRAFLTYESGFPTTPYSLCTRIKGIEDSILKFEQLRRQETSADQQLVNLLEMTNLSQGGSVNPAALNSDLASLTMMTAAIGSDSTEFFPPVELSKPIAISLSKAEMVEIVKEAIRALRKYKPSEITIESSCIIDIGLMYYCNAVKAPNQFQSHTIRGKAGTRSILWECISQLKSHPDFNGSDDVTEVIKTWDSFSNNPTAIIHKDCVYKSHHTHFIWIVNNAQYGISPKSTPYEGGFSQRGDASILPSIRINSFNTTLYFLISVYLAERTTTGDKTYERAAVDSANWIMRWAYDEETLLVKDFTWHLEVAKEWGTPSSPPHVTGLFIEGLCVLASATGTRRWNTIAIDICDAAMEYPEWHDDAGVFNYVATSDPLPIDSTNAYRGLLIRGLLIAYQRNPRNEQFRHRVRNYINTQFNGLREHGYKNGSYGINWSGPYVGPSVDADMAALEALMAAVVVNHIDN